MARTLQRPSSPYEVVKVGKVWCLRLKDTKLPVAWSENDDAAWRSYCVEVGHV